MSWRNRLRYLYLAYFSRPASDRPLYRAIRSGGRRRLMEIGVGDGQRALRLISAAQTAAASEPVRYYGIDWFEARPDRPATITLKEAHKQVLQAGAKGQFLPGDPASALARGANAITGVELVVIRADVDSESLAKAWFYVPRVLAEDACVLQETISGDADQSSFRTLDRAEIQRLAAAAAAGRTRTAA